MKTVRLLPVVIAAGAALLLLKGIGLVTQGGYVLVGPAAVQAAPSSSAPSASSGPPTLVDSAPTLQDSAPTLPIGGSYDKSGKSGGSHGGDDRHGGSGHGGGHGGGDDGHGAAKEESHANGEAHAEEEKSSEHDTEDACAEVDDGHGGVTKECTVDPAAEGVPMRLNGAGEWEPMSEADAGNAAGVLERLSQRRAELDAREAELDMRLALIEAAEQRIEERTAALGALEKRIEAMVEEKKVLEEEQFVALVAMYEVMKPKDAAAIFDQLELPVMLRVARAMSPRKMAPILAKMNPARAKDLTANMAIDRVEPTIELAAEGIEALPQIVGQ